MNLKTLYTQAVTEFFTDSEEELNDYLSWDVSNVLYFSDLTPALKALDLKLQEYKQKFKGAALAVLQSDISASKLQFMGLPTLVNEFPVLSCQ